MSADLTAAGWRSHDVGGFFGSVGTLWSRKEADGWAYGLLTEGRHANRAGIIHGGMLLTLLDQMFSALAWASQDRKACLTVQLDTQFVNAAKPGDFIEARGRVVRSGGGLVFMTGGLAAGGREIATASCILKVVSGKAPRAVPSE